MLKRALSVGAISISVTSGSYHTFRGIRIGTTLRALSRKLRGYDHFSCTKNIGCTVSDRADIARPGAALTSFGVVNGKVAGMVVSYVFNDTV